MNSVADYVRILRPINIIISAGTVVVCAGILNAFENIFLLISTVLTVGLFIGGANIFNDIQDKKEDNINKPERPIAAGQISLKAAGNYAKVLFISGAGMCFLLPLSATLLVWFIVFPLLIFYSLKLKSIPLVGNGVIAFLLGLTFLFCGLVFENINPMFIPAGLAFSLTLVRELIKDIEDMEGDKKSGLRTFPIMFGLDKAVQLVILLSVATGIVSVIPYFTNLYSAFYLIPLVLGVELPLTIVVFSFMKSHSRSTARKSSILLKIATIMGIISIYTGAKIGT
ncbi:MAG: geranylgeranylglycerol-phosphate geranylgeranyltransferase [Candidatus Marinimicrobia bacterium]|jgi:4-hydroxybenzoate polyprenyltransferase|nr:geranylgeranylglycerol-phosphate geranylgeranyltransferase [Candidatus Neomarinimicrobiota bacterium]|tara:strand:- start:121 stop:969 length:849 start_codon:yes stop_codon:yes gene_type:complete